MKLNYKFVHLSLWLALITIVVFPGNTEDGGVGMKCGFPMSFFTYYHHDQWFIKGVSFNILNYLINAAVIYCLALVISTIFNKITRRKLE